MSLMFYFFTEETKRISRILVALKKKLAILRIEPVMVNDDSSDSEDAKFGLPL